MNSMLVMSPGRVRVVGLLPVLAQLVGSGNTEVGAAVGRGWG